jgi:hypothetical protein
LADIAVAATDAVIQFQRLLEAKGFYRGELTGIYDAPTHDALKQFALEAGGLRAVVVDDQGPGTVAELLGLTEEETTFVREAWIEWKNFVAPRPVETPAPARRHLDATVGGIIGWVLLIGFTGFVIFKRARKVPDANKT